MISLENAKIRTVQRQRQIRYSHKTAGIEQMNGFAFRISDKRLELIYFKDTLPVCHYCIEILDSDLLMELMHQPVMRVEEAHENGEEFAFVAVNERLLSLA